MIGTTEVLIICGVVVLLFGAGAIPKIARSIGRARKEFEDGINDSQEKKEEPGKKDS
jgi:sec-independent protein translocase protein TatA